MIPMYQINRFSIIHPLGIVGRKSYNPYLFSVFTRCLKVDRARCAIFNSLISLTSYLTENTDYLHYKGQSRREIISARKSSSNLHVSLSDATKMGIFGKL